MISRVREYQFNKTQTQSWTMLLCKRWGEGRARKEPDLLLNGHLRCGEKSKINNLVTDHEGPVMFGAAHSKRCSIPVSTITKWTINWSGLSDIKDTTWCNKEQCL